MTHEETGLDQAKIAAEKEKTKGQSKNPTIEAWNQVKETLNRKMFDQYRVFVFQYGKNLSISGLGRLQLNMSLRALREREREKTLRRMSLSTLRDNTFQIMLVRKNVN